MDEVMQSRSEVARRAALRREGEQYLRAGMIDQVELVNEQLRVVGEPTIDVPSKPARQTRQSTQAATRQKRTAG